MVNGTIAMIVGGSHQANQRAKLLDVTSRDVYRAVVDGIADVCKSCNGELQLMRGDGPEFVRRWSPWIETVCHDDSSSRM
jgi:hypothetical protein